MSEPIDDGYEVCPSCKGHRNEIVQGEPVLCTNCNGLGIIRDGEAGSPDDIELTTPPHMEDMP